MAGQNINFDYNPYEKLAGKDSASEYARYFKLIDNSPSLDAYTKRLLLDELSSSKDSRNKMDAIYKRFQESFVEGTEMFKQVQSRMGADKKPNILTDDAKKLQDELNKQAKGRQLTHGILGQGVLT